MRTQDAGMGDVAIRSKLTVEAYLAGEKVSPIRHEFVNGEVFAMVGASKTHNRITKRLARLVDDLLEGTLCEAFATDVKVRVKTATEDRFYYPDLYVECEPFTEDEYYSERPVLLVEVLSNTTERSDRSDKFYAYRKLPSLTEYVLVAQDERRIEVYRRSTQWDLEVYGYGNVLRLESIGGELEVDQIYASVDLTDN